MSLLDLLKDIPDLLKDISGKDAAAWGGVAVNFFLNIFNIQRTNKLRTQTNKSDEFKRLRPAVDAAFAEIRTHRLTLKSLEAAGGTVANFQKQVMDCNKSLVQSYDKLVDALDYLDASLHVAGADWCDCISDAWDDVLSSFDSAYVRGKDMAAVKDAIRKIIGKIDVMLKIVHSKLDEQIT